MTIEGRVSVDAALALIRAAVRPLGSEMIAVAHAQGRITAAPVLAGADTPRFRAAAMDGYAFASRDVAGATADRPAWLTIGAMVPAGTSPPALCCGAAVPIATGAPAPLGADVVITRECAVLVEGRLCLAGPVASGQHVRAIGEDGRAGAPLLPAGVAIAPDAVGVLLAFGVHHVCVARQPRLGLLTTGSELRPDGGALGPGLLTDSNGPMIAACAQAARIDCDFIGRAADCPLAFDAVLDAAMASASADIMLSTGGVSIGAFDLVRSRLEARGCTILFHGVAMRPGKPLLFALLPDGRPYFGLPGTPLAALVAFRFFVGAALRQMVGLPPETGDIVHTNESGRPGTSLFLRGRKPAHGEPAIVDTALDQRAHILRSLLSADCWLRIDCTSPAPPVARCYPRQLTLDQR
ncbi:molybdopterin molybdotransferase MoeA [Sandarakinorhabdus sp.]|uniref:molybdopterin molybdotransferase MoeA n=1 Tax=Sandarakinorhabdus sp. TaxID=1916663 RepID=UPI003F6F2666